MTSGWDEPDETPRSTPTPERRAPSPSSTKPSAKVKLILEDGTAVLPPSDTEMEERFQYLTENLIPGAGSSSEGASNEGNQG
jgi:hypothetical protein